MKKFIIILELFLISNTFAQEIKLGFRTEMFAALYEKTDNGKNFTIKPTPNLYFVIGIKPSSYFQFDIRPCYSATENYLGFEFGMYGKYFPSESIYLLAAINSHFMGGEAHGTISNNATTFLLPGVGIGIVISNHASIEVLLFIPYPKEWDYDYEFGAGELKKITSKFDLIFKIGFGLEWPL